jgi:predicted amidophosphoribosyltransferase
MVKINPRRLKGSWFEGYALDLHTLSSVFLGYNEYGHKEFDNKYSEIGELLNRLKYKSEKDVINDILETAISFLKVTWQISDNLNGIIPIPPSITGRPFQPVIELAKGISSGLDINLYLDYLIKVKQTQELKNIYEFKERMEILKDIYEIKDSELADKNVLLFDDLYRSGATLNTATNYLIEKGKVNRVYVLAVTKTRSIT